MPRRADLFLALSGIAGIQANFDTEMLESAIDTAWAVRNDAYPNVEHQIDRILDCSEQDLVAIEELRRLMKFSFDYEADPRLMVVHLAYMMCIASAPTGTPANEVQIFTRGAGVIAGTWQPGILVGTRVKKTQPLAWDISAANLKVALESLSAIGRNNTTITYAAGVWTVTFVNNLASASMPLLSADSTGLTGGVITPSRTTAGSAKFHLLSRFTSFQPVTFGMVAGFRNSVRSPKKYKSVTVDTFSARGSHAQPRVTASMGVVGSGEVFPVSGGYAVPVCQIYRGVRFKDCQLIVDGVDYSANDLFRDFDMTYTQGIVSDDDAYTAQDEDVHRLERADQRRLVINASVLGEEGDTIFNLAEALAEVAVSLRLGRSGSNVLVNSPKAVLSLRNPSIGYDGSVKRATVRISIEPEIIPGDSTTPFTISAENTITSTLLGIV